MKFNKRLVLAIGFIMAFGLILTSCQKLDRPVLKELILDPPPPTLTLMGSKSYWHFNGNARDTGEYRMATTTQAVSFVPGVTEGDAAQIGTGGYIASTPVAAGLKTPGSLTVAFWMKGAAGPVQGGAQGLFAISSSTQFWGNVEIFLENYSDPADANAVFMKIHLLNANVTGGGEEWLQNDDVKLKNVLGKWTHIALVYDAATSKVTLYKDGVATGINNKVLGGGNYGNLKFDNATGVVLGSFAFQTTPSFASHGNETWAKSFNGALDQFRIFTTPLSPAEINNLFTKKL